MTKAAFALLALCALSSSAFAETVKEACGLNAEHKKFSFSHQATFMDDKAQLEFTQDGGFTLYDENGVNHVWTVDAQGFGLIKRDLTAGARSYLSASLDASPRQSSNGQTTFTDWTNGFVELLHDITHMEITLTETSQPHEQVEAALYCAQKILVNAAARGQEKHLEGKLNVKF